MTRDGEGCGDQIRLVVYRVAVARTLQLSDVEQERERPDRERVREGDRVEVAPAPTRRIAPKTRREVSGRIVQRPPGDRVATAHRWITDLAEPCVVRPSHELIQGERDARAGRVLAVEGRTELVLKDAITHPNQPRSIDRGGGRIG